MSDLEVISCSFDQTTEHLQRVKLLSPSGLARNVDLFSLNSIMNHALFITKFGQEIVHALAYCTASKT